MPKPQVPGPGLLLLFFINAQLVGSNPIASPHMYVCMSQVNATVVSWLGLEKTCLGPLVLTNQPLGYIDLGGGQ